MPREVTIDKLSLVVQRGAALSWTGVPSAPFTWVSTRGLSLRHGLGRNRRYPPPS